MRVDVRRSQWMLREEHRGSSCGDDNARPTALCGPCKATSIARVELYG